MLLFIGATKKVTANVTSPSFTQFTGQEHRPCRKARGSGVGVGMVVVDRRPTEIFLTALGLL